MLEGLTASDAEDGDLTDSILISGTSHFVEKGNCMLPMWCLTVIITPRR